MALDDRLVGLDADGTLIGETDTGVPDEASALEDVSGDNGLEDVEFKVAGCTADAHGYVVAHDLGGDHGEGFGLGGVHFAGHDGGAGLVVGNDDFANAGTGTAAEHANVIANFHERNGDALEGAGEFDHGIVGGEGFKLVGSRYEGLAGEFRDFGGYVLGVACRGVEAGANGCSAEGEFGHHAECVFDGPDAVVELLDVAGKFLAQGEGGGVHEVRSARFDDVFKRFTFCSENGAQMLHTGKRHVDDLEVSRNVHRGGEGVVGRLRLVDVVVGVQDLVGVGERTSLKDMATVGNHLVAVHVALRARTGLPNHQRELVVQLAGDDFVADVGNELRFFGGKDAEVGIGQGCGLLQVAKCMNDFLGHAAFGANLEVVA